MRISDWSSDVCSSDLMVGDWTGRYEGAAIGWSAVLFVIGLFVIGWRWAYVAVLAMLMLGVGGWSTVQDSFTDMRVRSYFGLYTVTDDPYHHPRRPAPGAHLPGLQRATAGRAQDPT